MALSSEQSVHSRVLAALAPTRGLLLSCVCCRGSRIQTLIMWMRHLEHRTRHCRRFDLRLLSERRPGVVLRFVEGHNNGKQNDVEEHERREDYKFQGLHPNAQTISDKSGRY